MQQRNAGRELHGLLHVMRHENGSLAEIGAQPQKFALQIEARDRIQRPERFIEKKNLRIGRKSTRDAHSLPLSTESSRGKTMREFTGVEADTIEQFRNAGSDFVFRPTFEPRHQTILRATVKCGNNPPS